MPKNTVTDWSQTAASNTDIAGIDLSEGCPPAGINDAIRTAMAQIATWATGLMTKAGGIFAGPIVVQDSVNVKNSSGDSLVVQSRNDRALLIFAGANDGSTKEVFRVDRATGAAAFSSKISRDPFFYLDLPGANPAVIFDNGDGIFYDRTSDKFLFSIGAVFVASIDGSGTLRCAGSIIPNSPL